MLVLWSASSLYRVDVEREHAEVALRVSRERLRLMVDGAKDYAIFMLDLEGTVQSWNPGAERIHGYREEDIIGHPFSRFYTNEDVSHRKPQKDLATAAREGAVEDEGWRLRNDGSQFWANAILTALRGDDGRLRGFAMQCRITTEDPDRHFIPDYGRITTYRSAGGFAVRLDGGNGFGGAVITPYFDSLLVKMTTWGQTCRSRVTIPCTTSTAPQAAWTVPGRSQAASGKPECPSKAKRGRYWCCR